MTNSEDEPHRDDAEGEQVPPDDVFVLMLGLMDDQGSKFLAPALREAHHARGRRLLGLMTLVDVLPAYDEALAQCTSVASYFDAHPLLAEIGFLVRRTRSDLEISVEALLIGRQAAVADCMRDVMEIEMLFRDFGARPENISGWASADETAIFREFSPSRVRRRIAEDLYPGQNVDLPEAQEYQVHSMGLHPDPRGHPLAEKGTEPWQGDGKLLFEAGEILGHAARFFGAADFVMDSVDEIEAPRPTWHKDLELIHGAHQMWMEFTQRAQEEAGVQIPPRSPTPRKKGKPKKAP